MRSEQNFDVCPTADVRNRCLIAVATGRKARLALARDQAQQLSRLVLRRKSICTTTLWTYRGLSGAIGPLQKLS